MKGEGEQEWCWREKGKGQWKGKERERESGSKGKGVSKGESSYHSLAHIFRKLRCLTPWWQVPFLLLAKFKPN